ncbi:MAG: ACT domain-containing protein [Gammaproteobacteria bacterium]|nr:ACT domain-containing protein [Gammaproteobacteria bacterium]
MSEWTMLTLVGRDQEGIVAAVTAVLHKEGCQLGETSMMRLGGNFSMMLMLSCGAEVAVLEALSEVAEQFELRLHLDQIEAQLHDHRQANVRVTVHGADRIGLVAEVTAVLAAGGLSVLDLCSDVAGSADKPLYLLQIEGVCELSAEALQLALRAALDEDVQFSVDEIETLLG